MKSIFLADDTREQDASTALNILDMSVKPLSSPTSKTARGILAKKDLIRLYQSIETALPDLASRIILFASGSRGEGTTTISAGLSAIAAGLGHRSLLIDILASSAATTSSLIDVAIGRASPKAAIILSTDASAFDRAHLTTGNTASDVLVHRDKIRKTLTTLCNQYQLIVFHVSDILADPIGASLCDIADGVVLVTEAERTRVPVARQAIQLLSGKGAKIIGQVLNKRRYYIPHWLYRWL